MGHPRLRAAGIAAGALLIAIGMAAQFGGSDLFGTHSYGRPVSVNPSPEPADQSPSPTPLPSPSAQAQTVADYVTAAGTIYPPSMGGGEHHKKKK